jgi:adenylate cyclase
MLWIPALREWSLRLDTDFADQGLRFTPGPAVRDDLVFLGIDERSLRMDVGADLIAGNPVLGMMAARFPWDRRVHAAAIEKLVAAGARLVVLDLAISEPSDPEADAALAATIARQRDRVVLVSAFGPDTSNDRQFTLSEPWDDFLGDGPDWTRCGYANFRPDGDGIVRSASYSTTLSAEQLKPVRADEPVFPSLAAEIIAALGKTPPQGKQGLRFATNEHGLAHNVYEPISILEIFDPATWTTRHRSGAAFRDKIIIIGPAAPRFKDQHQTPVGLLSGPQLHLQAVTCGLENAFVTRIHPVALMALAGVVCAWLALRISRKPFLTLAIAAAAATLVVTTAWTLAATSGILLGFSPFLIVLGAGTVVGQTHSLVAERVERSRLHREFRRFVSRDLADTLVDHPEIYQTAAAGRKRKLAVLFSDVRGFTSRSEAEDPQRLVGQLNEYFSAMVAIVFRHGGTLDKFIGDAVMAHWGALDDGKDDATHARDAIAAATEMIRTLDALNARWSADGLTPYRIGIGIHLGDAIAGEIGSAERTEFAVIGDAVNLASRTEGLTKVFQAPILCTGAAARAAGCPESLRRLAKVRVVGRHEPVEIWGPATTLVGDAAYATALAAFEAGDFANAADLTENEGSAKLLHAWAIARIHEPPATWDGVVDMTGK